MNKDFIDYRKDDIRKKLDIMGIMPLDVMITGVTGAGKSTTVNAIFTKNVAQVGKGVAPETMQLDSYMLNDSIRLWDTPGLGDGVEKDAEHIEKMLDLLYAAYNTDDGRYFFIDLVVVIIEGINRDMGTTYKLLNNVIFSNFPSDRVLVAINQADVAMKNRYWDKSNNIPQQELKTFLEQQSASIQKRIYETTKINIRKPVYYSAERGYNVDKFYDMIIDNIPETRRPIPYW